MNAALSLPLYWLLNGIDLALTLKLYFDKRLLEINPLAASCLAAHGAFGLIVYKLGLTLFVTAICLYLWARRPMSARRTLRVSNWIVSGVVGYSIALLIMLQFSQ